MDAKHDSVEEIVGVNKTTTSPIVLNLFEKNSGNNDKPIIGESSSHHEFSCPKCGQTFGGFATQLILHLKLVHDIEAVIIDTTGAEYCRLKCFDAINYGTEVLTP